MEKFNVCIAINGRLDSNSIRTQLTESELFELMNQYGNVTVLRESTNQIAILTPETDRVVWLDVRTKNFDDVCRILSAYILPFVKRF